MVHIIAKLVQDFEQGKMTRRQLIQSLALTVTTASSVGAAPAPAVDGKGFKALAVNHIHYEAADYAKTRDFYADLFGMKVSEDDGKQYCRLLFGDSTLIVRTMPSNTPRVDHVAYTVTNSWDKDREAMGEELKRRGLQPRDNGTSFHFLDPEGFIVQLGGTRQ
jgi:catechol 2,3-dioxygenase-like lactoylglutathione lyase family enzyme